MDEMAAVGPKLNGIAHMKLGFGFQINPAVAHRGHATNKHASVIGAPVAHDLVATIVGHVGGGEAAREGLGQNLKLVLVCARRFAQRCLGVGGKPLKRAIDELAVHAHDRAHVLGALHTALDLKGRNARLNELGQNLGSAQVFRAQKMLAGGGQGFVLQRTIVQGVGQAACLSAATAVGRAPADHRRHEALPRIAHADGAVAEGLDLHTQLGGSRRKHGNLLERKLASERHALGAQLGGSAQALDIVRVHLCGNVQARALDGTHDFRSDARILHDEGVDPGSISLTRKLHGVGQLGRKHHRVKRQVDLHSAQMGVIAGLAQLIQAKVVGTVARVELPRAQVNRVGARTHGGMQASHVARRGEQLDAALVGGVLQYLHVCSLALRRIHRAVPIGAGGGPCFAGVHTAGQLSRPSGPRRGVWPSPDRLTRRAAQPLRDRTAFAGPFSQAARLQPFRLNEPVATLAKDGHPSSFDFRDHVRAAGESCARRSKPLRQLPRGP